MEAVIIIAAVALSNVACFLIGVKTGQVVVKGEDIKLPEMPRAFDYAKQRQDKAQAEWEQAKIDIILRNIERYDGTPYGQEDVPKG